MRIIGKSIFAALLLVMGFTEVNAQEKKGVDFQVQGDLVSSYVWRGMYQSGAAFQPTLGLSVGGFSATAWGSVDFTGQGHKEADLTLGYTIGGLTLSVADLWWAGESGIKNSNENGKNNYFNFNNHTTNHILEAGISYQLPFEKFPLRLSWYTMVWGADKDVEGDQAYSTYIEAAYPFSVKTFDLVAMVGASPWKSAANYLNDGFAVTNVSLRASKDIRISERFSIPVFTQVLWNPNREDVHFVFGFSIRP